MTLGTYHRLGVHVYASDREVIRAASRKLTRLARRDPAWREKRQAFYRAMLKHHAAARALVREFRL